MSLLQVSQAQIVFQPNEHVKTIKLTNTSGTQSQRRPLMYKIKTNKIDYVDAKPSCGYISALDKDNQIKVTISSLNRKEYEAKLQVLYISHQLITQQVVQKNKKHFDIHQYNQFYDQIRNIGQRQVKTIVLPVTKKAEQPKPQAVDPSELNIKSERPKHIRPILKKQTKKQETSDGSTSIGVEKLTMLLLFALLIGICIGHSIGSHGSKGNIQGTLQQQQLAYVSEVNQGASSDQQQQYSQQVYQFQQQQSDDQNLQNNDQDSGSNDQNSEMKQTNNQQKKTPGNVDQHAEQF